MDRTVLNNGKTERREALEDFINEMASRELLYSDLCRLQSLFADFLAEQRAWLGRDMPFIGDTPVDIARPAVRLGCNWNWSIASHMRSLTEDIVSDDDADTFLGTIRGLLENEQCCGRPTDYKVPNPELDAVMATFNSPPPRTRMGFAPETAFSF